MSTSTETVFVEAISLPENESASLVEKLLLSFEPEEGSVEMEEAWKLEALDRRRAFDAGQLTERSAADVMHDARYKLKRRVGEHQ